MLRSKLTLFTAVIVLASSLARAQAIDADETILQGSNPNIVNPDDPNLGFAQRAQAPVEASIAIALRAMSKQSPAVFDVICMRCSQLPNEQKEDFYTDWQVQGPLSILDDSMKAPLTIWEYGARLNSKLVAMRMNIFVEGFYRNLEFETGGQKKIAQPWLKYNAAKKTYTAMRSGAGPVIYRNLLKRPNFDAKTGLVTLYRGTSQAELDRLAQIEKLAGNPATRAQAVAQANGIASSFKNGLFVSDLRAAAEEQLTEGRPAVLTIKVSASALKEMIAHDEVYMGYEMGHFELRFLSGPSILMLAEGLQK